MQDQATCPHANFDDYLGVCSDCGLDNGAFDPSNYATKRGERNIIYRFPCGKVGAKTWAIDLDCYHSKGRGYIAQIRPVAVERCTGYESISYELFSGQTLDVDHSQPRFNRAHLDGFAKKMLARFQDEYTAYDDMIDAQYHKAAKAHKEAAAKTA